MTDGFWSILGRWAAWLLPLIVAVSFLGVLGFSAWRRDEVDAKYRDLARQAVARQDFEAARLYYSRLVAEDRPVDPQDEFNWAQILISGDNLRAAVEIMERLAPDDSTGYADAHRFRAIQLARRVRMLAEEPDRSVERDEALDLLERHLQRSGTGNRLQLHDLWTEYYLAAGRPREALKEMAEAASIDPRRWPQVAAVSARLGNQVQRNRAVAEAEKFYSRHLEENPRDHAARIALAQVLVADDRLDAAEQRLQQGLALSKRPELRRALSDLHVIRITKLKAPTKEDFGEFNRLLGKAMEADPANPTSYSYLMQLYASVEDDADKLALRDRLQRSIAKGETVAFAHFALGGMLWLEGESEDSLWHMEKAFELNPEMVYVANNLAWILAEQDPPDLERAYQLIEQAVAKRPDDFDIRDTKGLILMKMERYDEALIEFESILPRSGGEARRLLHERLAEIYDSLGKETLAAAHRDEASELQRAD